uniref:Isochorismatase domain-containing protein n=1 Tax=Echinococcus granulosus TaxID=6210 RepID=A0A068WTV9_ECHGR|nr:hypothetical protein EgrG_000076100 [Echinococcus granulosus]
MVLHPTNWPNPDWFISGSPESYRYHNELSTDLHRHRSPSRQCLLDKCREGGYGSDTYNRELDAAGAQVVGMVVATKAMQALAESIF